jgi:hypothetical protein
MTIGKASHVWTGQQKYAAMVMFFEPGTYVSSTVADETSFHSMVPPSSLCDLPDTAPHPVHHASIHIVSAEGGDDCPSLETRLTQ